MYVYGDQYVNPFYLGMCFVHRCLPWCVIHVVKQLSFDVIIARPTLIDPRENERSVCTKQMRNDQKNYEIDE